MSTKRITLKTARKRRGNIPRAAVRRAIASLYKDNETFPVRASRVSRTSVKRKTSSFLVSDK
jgi:hypothetical protein